MEPLLVENDFLFLVFRSNSLDKIILTAVNSDDDMGSVELSKEQVIQIRNWLSDWIVESQE